MPDVGVLNLEIHDNSEKAAQGLEALDGVLLRIRHAVQGALGLSKVATEVRKLSKAVDESLDGSVISRINQLTEALSKLNGLGSINIKINGKTSVDNIVEAVQKAQESMTGINTGFDDIGKGATGARSAINGMNSGVKETEQLMQSTAWSQGAAKFRELFDAWSRFKSAMTLGPGKQVGVSTEVEKGWAEWKNGAIEVEGTVTEAMGNMANQISAAQVKLLEAGGAVESVGNATRTATGSMNAFNASMNAVHNEADLIENSLKNIVDITETWKDLSAKDKSLYKDIFQGNELISGVIEQLSSLKGDSLDRFSSAILGVANGAGEAKEKIRQLYELLEKGVPADDASKIEKTISDTDRLTEARERLNAATEAGKNATAFTASGRVIDTENIDEGLSKLELLREKLDILRNEFADRLIKGKLDEKSINSYQLRIVSLQEQIDRLQAKYDSLNDSPGMVVQSDQARQVAESYMKANSELDLMMRRLEEMKIALGNGIISGSMDTRDIMRAYKEINRLEEAIRNTKSEAYSMSDSWKSLRADIKSMFEPLTKLGKQFVNIAKRMAMRAVIRMFVKGMKEGVENMYVWSKAMGTDFAPAMDRAATAILDLKNSLGAMASEALMAFLPVLEDITNAVIDVINFFNQLFAAINGKDTWMEYVRGSAGAKAFEDTTKAAKGTQKAIKDLLADWDELNIIQSENAGGRSGSGLTYDPKTNGTYRESPISDLAKSLAKVVNFFGGIAGIAAGVAGIWLLKKGDAAFMKYYQDHWPKPEKPSGGATTQQEIKDAADKATNNVVNDTREKITNAVKENTEATQQLVKAEHEVQKLDVAKEIAQMTNDKLDGMAQLRLGNGQSYMGMTLEQFTAQNPLLAGNRVGLRIDAAKEVGSRMLPAKVDTINLMSGVDTISVDIAKAVETSANPSAATPVKATVPALDVVEDVLKGEDIDWDYTFGDGKDHNNPYGTHRKMPDYQPSYQIPEYPKNWDTTPINATAGALESSAKALESTAAATIQAAVQTETATAGVTANLAAATEAVNESVPLLEETAQTMQGLLPSGSVFAEAYEIPQVDMSSGTNEVIGITDGQSFFWFKADDAAKYGLGNLDWSYAGNNSFVLTPEQPLTAGEKLSGYTFAAKNWAAQHAQEGMMALIAAEFIGQYGKGKKEQREAYSEYYGEEYDKLSGAKKALVHQGYSPEIADALVEATKGAWKEYSPGFLGWIPDFAEGAVSLVEDGLVTAGEAAEVVENVLDLGDAAGGIWLNSIFFPESGSVEKGITQALENPITQWVMDVVRDVFSGPDAPEKETVDQALQQYINYKANATGRFEELTSGYGAETEAKFQDWLDQYFGENGVYPDLEKIYEWAINHRPYGVGEDVGNALQETLDLLNYYRNEYLHMVELYEQEYGPYAPKAQYPDTSGKFWNAGMLIAGTPQDMGYGYRPNMAGAGDEADMASATEKGTKAANGELEDNTSETNRLLRQLIANGLRINLTPNSTMGFFGARAAEAVDRVNG